MGYENLFVNSSYRFLVTGGAGFIGSNIVEALLNKGCFVRVIDNFSTGKKENISNFVNNPLFELIDGDIRDLEVCTNACKNIDFVLHQAALGSVPRSIKEPLLYEEVNIKGTLNMMIAARDNKVKRFVYASSSSVYGNDINLPKIEERVGSPLSPYAISKKTNELYGYIFNSIYGLETVGLRYFNVFGKHQDPNSYYSAVIPKFIKSMLQGNSPTINGDGSFSRDFTYVENVIEANLKACHSSQKIGGEIFNIAYGANTTINELYNTLSKELNFNKSAIYGTVREGDIPHSHADISKAIKLLEYSPSFSFKDGISLTIRWYTKSLI